jgi:hypothetical protein
MTVDKIVLMEVKHISEVFNNGSMVEISLKSNENEGELFLRVSTFEADKYKLGQECAIRITKI